MPRGDARFDKGRAGRQAQRGLGDVAGRIGHQRGAEVSHLLLAGGRADEHAVAARTMDLLDDQLLEVVEHVGKVVLLAAEVGGHVVEDRLFTEVELDHLGHIGVDRLVVGHPGADGVGQRDVAGAVGTQQAGAAQGRVRTESLGVEKVVVHPAVDHVDPLGALRGAHVDEVVLDEEVLALDQLHPHLLRQEGVLEVGAVVHAGGQHHHRGIVDRGRGHRAQGFEQHVGVMGHRGHAVLAEQLGKEPHHHLAVFQHVAHATGHPQVVLEHVVAATAIRIAGPHDVDARDVRVDVARHIHPHHLGAELRVLEDLLGGDQAGLEDVLPVVDVVDEAVERRDPLGQPLFHLRPLMGRNHAGNQVEGDQALGARAVFVLGAIHRESDADPAEDHLGLFAPGAHQAAFLARQPVSVDLVVRAYLCAAGEGTGVHFVEALFHRQLSSVPGKQ